MPNSADNNKLHIGTTVDGFNSVSKNGSYHSGALDYYYTVLDLDGNLEFVSYHGGVVQDGNFLPARAEM